MKRDLQNKGFLIIFSIFFILIAFSSRELKAKTLRAGVSKINITIDEPTELINDSLFAKVLMVDDGNNKVVIITLDIVRFTFLPELREQIWNKLKISGNNVMVSSSHNHWVKNQLADNYLDRIVRAVENASQNMVPVKVGAGSGIENRITMNRRIMLNDGQEYTIRRATPEPQDENVKGISGPFDPEIGILRLDKMDGKPLAVLYNFAIHPYTGVPNKGVTASTPGFASKVIEDNLGDGVIALYVNGAAGDITPILYKDVNTPKPDEMLGSMLGLSTLQGWRNISVKNNASLSVIRKELELPARTKENIQIHIDTLEARRTRIHNYFKGEGCGSLGGGTKLNFKSFMPLYIKHMMSAQYPSDYSYRYMQEELIGKNDLEMLDDENKNDLEKYLSSIYKMEELIVTEANLDYLKHNKPKEPIVAEIMGIRIGEFVLITFPGEAFAQVGLNIKTASPQLYTYVSGYTNYTNTFPTIGYAPTFDAYSGNAYESSYSELAPEWQKIFEDNALEIIENLQK